MGLPGDLLFLDGEIEGPLQQSQLAVNLPVTRPLSLPLFDEAFHVCGLEAMRRLAGKEGSKMFGGLNTGTPHVLLAFHLIVGEYPIYEFLDCDPIGGRPGVLPFCYLS